MSTAASTEAKVVPAPAVITLAGKVAIVTGASRGIGAGIALRLARDGAKVVVNYQNDKKSADAVVAAIKSIPNGDATAIQGDASKSDDIDRLFSETKRIYGGVDIVVANAGVWSASPIATTTNEEFNRVFVGNVTGPFYTFRAAANNVRDNGRIVVIGSGLKTGTSAGYGPYSATKAAVEVLANTLAQELGSKGITVNTIHPGAVGPTDMLRNATGDNKDVYAYFSSLTPFKRLGSVADIGDAVALIVSESARWISGQNINVSGAAKS
jgi:3-oxoacyl-[acyl-carrier protein] reductase